MPGLSHIHKPKARPYLLPPGWYTVQPIGPARHGGTIYEILDVTYYKHRVVSRLPVYCLIEHYLDDDHKIRHEVRHIRNGRKRDCK